MSSESGPKYTRAFIRWSSMLPFLSKSKFALVSHPVSIEFRTAIHCHRSALPGLISMGLPPGACAAGLKKATLSSDSVIMRRVMGMVCLLVLSIGTLVSAVHDHHSDAAAGHSQCAACAWQTHASGDVPARLALPEPPHSFNLSPQAEPVLIIDRSARLHPSRGPPFFL